MTSPARLSAVLLVLAVSAAAQTLTVSPAGTAATEGNSNNAFPFNATTVRRYMQIHGDLGTTPMMITKLSFRVNASTTNYTGTKTFDMELFMGEGNTGAVTNPSLVYANNYFLPAVNVIPRTNITFGPTGQAVSPGPNPFTMDLPLTTPFAYTAAYPLVWEAAVHGVTAVGTTSQLDADSSSTTSATQSITGTGCIASTQSTTLMTHGVTCADVGGTLHFGVTVSAGPNSAPCFLALGVSNPNLAVPGLCSNLLTDLSVVLPYGTTSATGTITTETLPFALFLPNNIAGAVLFTQVHALDVGRTDPIPVTNSNGRQVTIPASNLTHVNQVTRLWNSSGGTAATQAVFATSTVGYGLVTQFTH